MSNVLKKDKIQVVGKYELRKKIGQGTFSKVRLGINTETKQNVAVKVVDLKQMAKEGMEKQLKREIALLKNIKHKNIVQLIEVLKSKTHCYIVMELVTGGELFDRIVQAQRFDEDTARRYFQQLISGIAYCHSQGVAHRDLKPENLLLSDDDTLKISDFGLSSMVSTDAEGKEGMLHTICGTPHYLAPEVLTGNYEGKSADVWSCGVILFVMLSGCHPFDDATVSGLFQKIQNLQFKYPSYFSKDAIDLLSKIMVVDPQKRYTVAEIMQHKWFKVGFNNKEASLAPLKITPLAALTNEDLENAITPTVVCSGAEAGVASARGPSASNMNAFDLISHLNHGVVASLVREKEPVIRINTRFMCKGIGEEIFKNILVELEKKKGSVRPKEGEMELKAKFVVKSGFIDISVKVFPTSEFGLVLVEVQRLSGDTLAFQTVYRDLKSKFGSNDEVKARN